MKQIKALGQNFLTTTTVPKLMVDLLDTTKEDTIVEIGPGEGAVTKLLAETPANIIAIELDSRFANLTKQKYPSINVINENVLDWLPDYSPKTYYKLIGSIPYYITSPIFHAIVRATHPKIAVILLQKEVGQRICAQQDDTNYLSALIQTFFTTEYVHTVDRSYFAPVPKVDSAIIKLTSKDIKLDKESIKKYEGFLHKAYSNPRKMLNKVFNIHELQHYNLEGNKRAQNISAEEWFNIFNDKLIE